MVLPISPICIPQIKRGPKGPQWTFSESVPHPFSWVEMVAHLSNTLRGEQTQTDMALVVGRGLVSCVFTKDPIMYDHKCYQILSEEKKAEMHPGQNNYGTFLLLTVAGVEHLTPPSSLLSLLTPPSSLLSLSSVSYPAIVYKLVRIVLSIPRTIQ